MKKSIALVLVFSMAISGCNLFKKDPQKAVNEGVLKFAEVTKMSSALKLSGVVQAVDAGKTSNINFAVEADSRSDVANKESPAMDSNFKIDVSMNDQKISGSASVRLVNKTAYFKVEKLNLPGEAGTTLNEQLKSFLNVWWSVPLGKENVFGKMNDEQEKIKEILKTTTFFTGATLDGEEDVLGTKSSRYKVDLNKEALTKFIGDAGRATGNVVSPEEEAAIAEALKDVVWSGGVWVGDDDYLHKAKGTVSVQPKDGPSSSFEIDYSAGDFGKDVSISAPEGAQEFNPLMMLPLLSVFGMLDKPAAAEPATDVPLGAKQVPGAKAPPAATPAAPAKK